MMPLIDEPRCNACDQPMDAYSLLRDLEYWWSHAVLLEKLENQCLACYSIEYQLSLVKQVRILQHVRPGPMNDEDKFIVNHDLEEIYAGKYIDRTGKCELLSKPFVGEWTPHECELRKTGVVVPLEKRSARWKPKFD